jgi:hypothetical protein
MRTFAASLASNQPSFRKYNSKIRTLRWSSSQLLVVEISDDLQTACPCRSVRDLRTKKGRAEINTLFSALLSTCRKFSLSALTLATAAFKASVCLYRRMEMKCFRATDPCEERALGSGRSYQFDGEEVMASRRSTGIRANRGQAARSTLPDRLRSDGI